MVASHLLCGVDHRLNLLAGPEIQRTPAQTEEVPAPSFVPSSQFTIDARFRAAVQRCLLQRTELQSSPQRRRPVRPRHRSRLPRLPQGHRQSRFVDLTGFPDGNARKKRRRAKHSDASHGVVLQGKTDGGIVEPSLSRLCLGDGGAQRSADLGERVADLGGQRAVAPKATSATTRAYSIRS